MGKNKLLKGVHDLNNFVGLESKKPFAYFRYKIKIN